MCKKGEGLAIFNNDNQESPHRERDIKAKKICQYEAKQPCDYQRYKHARQREQQIK